MVSLGKPQGFAGSPLAPTLRCTGTLLISLGAVLIGYFGAIQEQPHSLDELLTLYSRPAFVAFGSCFALALAGLLTGVSSRSATTAPVYREPQGWKGLIHEGTASLSYLHDTTGALDRICDEQARPAIVLWRAGRSLSLHKASEAEELERVQRIFHQL